MIKIKHKIAIPFMSIIVLMPLLTLLVFNIAMNAYVTKTTINELNRAIEATNYLIKQEFNKGIIKNSEDEVTAIIPKLNAVLKTSRLATNAEIVIYGRQGRLLYPKNIPENSILTPNILNTVRNLDLTNRQIQTLEIDNKKFLVSKSTAKQTNYKLTYILSMDNARDLIKVINLILVCIIAAATIIALIIAMIISKSISKPVKNISIAAEKIGKGQYISIEPNETSEEIYELCKNINNMSVSLQHAENAQKTFLQNASHELRTPLMSIQGYAEGIMNGVFVDNHDAAGIISEESKRLTAMVEELLMLSRIENKTYKLNINEVDLSNQIKDYIQRLNGLALKQQKTIKYVPSEEAVPVNVDEELLSHAIMNVASNGIRHANAMLDITLITKVGNVQVRIRDDGSGISQEELPHIFERFFKGNGGNTGLGLSIAKSSIELLGGEIKAQNWEKGAEFIITMPLKK